jgi:hypothetical protein
MEDGVRLNGLWPVRRHDLFGLCFDAYTSREGLATRCDKTLASLQSGQYRRVTHGVRGMV